MPNTMAAFSSTMGAYFLMFGSVSAYYGSGTGAGSSGVPIYTQTGLWNSSTSAINLNTAPYASGTAPYPHLSGTAPAPSSSGAGPYGNHSSTAPAPYSSGTAPVPISSGTAPYPYSSGTAPIPHSSHPAPYGNASSTAPYPYSSGTAPYPYSSGTAPVPISSGTAPYPYSSGTVPVPHSSGPAPYSNSSSTAPYPYSSGTAPNPISSGTAPYPHSSGTAPVPHSSGTAPYPHSFGTVPIHNSASTAPYANSSSTTGSPYPSGTGSVPDSSGTAPYPYPSGTGHSYSPHPEESSHASHSNGGHHASHSYNGHHASHSNNGHHASHSDNGQHVHSTVTRTTGVHESVTSAPYHSTTDVVVTVITTSYVTTCPVTVTEKTGPTYAVHSSLTTSTVYSTYTSTICTKCVAHPTSAPKAKTDDVVIVVITTSYVTTCPARETATIRGSPYVHTGITTSTVYSTFVSTICTRCVASPTPAPTTKTQDVDTVITSSYVTTYPVTKIITIGGSQSVHIGVSSSTVYSVYTTTIGTKPVAPPTSAASAPPKTLDVVTTVIVYTSYTTYPVTQTITESQSVWLYVTPTVSTVYRTVTSIIGTKDIASPIPSPTQPVIPHDVVPTVIVYTTTAKYPYTQTIVNGKTTSIEVTQSESIVYETVTSYGSSPTPVVEIPAGPSPFSNTQAGEGVVPGAPGSPTSYSVFTMTIVPLSSTPAVPPVDTYVPPPQPAPSHGPVGGAPYPVVNGTSPHGATGTSASPSSAPTEGVPGSTLESFKGAASQMGSSVLGGLVLVVMAALML